MPRLFAASLTLAFLVCALPAHAQTGRVSGQVMDQSGKGIKGATVRASNPDAAHGVVTSTTDGKGRFAMIGLRAGVWQFAVEAPGFEPSSGSAPVRAIAVGAPMRIVLARTPEVIPGALTRSVVDEVSAADALRAQGRLDQALTAYQVVLAKNTKFTALNVAIGDTFRMQADRETNQAAKQALYVRAVAAYQEAVKDGAASERARLDLGLAQVSAGQTEDGVRTLQAVVETAPNSAAAKDASARLADLRR
jgi:tetratricopeptide (TPR) repeat protein